MTKNLLLSPVNVNAGLYTTSEGLMRAFENHGLKTHILRPIGRDNHLNDPSHPMPYSTMMELLSKGQEDTLLEFILTYKKMHTPPCDILLIEGVLNTQNQGFGSNLNHKIASALSADVILITSVGNRSVKEVTETFEIEAKSFGGIDSPHILGCILNKVGAPTDKMGNTRIDLFDPPKSTVISPDSFKNSKIKILGFIPWNRTLMSSDVLSIQHHLGATLINPDTYHNTLVHHFVLAAATLENVSKVLQADVMIITPGDRSDIILATCMAYLSGVKISALLLTGSHCPSQATLKLCKKAMDEGFAILLTETDSLRTSIALQNLNTKITASNSAQLERIKNFIAEHIDKEWVSSLVNQHTKITFSPAAFRFYLMEKAKALKRTILLPESDDPRILLAANTCSRKGIASIVLLGKKEVVLELCKKNGIELDPTITILDPEKEAKQYLAPLLELRKHKGLTEQNAIEYLHDPIVVGMMMLHSGKVHGLVAGANTTTANVVSPALKILKTADGVNLVSSIFFMCLEEEVLVYGDCAVNQNPTAEGLADIAIQSAASAKLFGIDPIIAMISYSTGSSGSGAEVEKVKKATEIVNQKAPHLLCDGPLQYDAAKVPSVAKTKAPNSPVAGKATVFIFPDLNTANTTYKAVQRTAGVLSIGPMLQGLAKPVNDLSRGASVDDIIFTIAITSIQD